MANLRKNTTRTIGYQPRSNKWREIKTVPALHLAGLWMEQAGFEIGDLVEVIVQQGKIIITNG